MKRPWTLLISPVVPDAQGTGIQRRAWMWASELSRSYDLVTLVINGAPVNVGGPSAVPGKMIVVAPDARSNHWWKRYTWRRPMPAAFHDVVRELPADPPHQIIVFRLEVLPVIHWLPIHWHDRLDIDIDDWESQKYRGFIWMALRYRQWRESASYCQFYCLSRITERAAVLLARVIYIAAAEDAKVLARKHPRAQVIPLPNRIVALSEGLPEHRHPQSASLLFVGDLRYLPNRDAIYWFVNNALPRLLKSHPQLTFYVVGDATEELARFLKAAPLVWAGRLPDLRDAYANTAIAIAPLRGGSGTKFKILEAWLYHRAVVATSHAVRGLGVSPGIHALVADDVDTFVAACQLLLDDESRRHRIAEAGHRLVHENFML